MLVITNTKQSSHSMSEDSPTKDRFQFMLIIMCFFASSLSKHLDGTEESHFLVHDLIM